MKFFKNTDYMTKLLLLNTIKQDESVTQASLGKYVGLSPAMVNTYIKWLTSEGYIVTDGNNKNRTYCITPKGEGWRKYLLISYMAELMDLSTLASEQLKSVIIAISQSTPMSVFLYGAGETGKVCAKIISEIPQVKLLGYIDDNQALHYKTILGITVFPLEEALKMKFDKIIITTFINNDTIIPRLRGCIASEKISSIADYN